MDKITILLLALMLLACTTQVSPAPTGLPPPTEPIVSDTLNVSLNPATTPATPPTTSPTTTPPARPTTVPLPIDVTHGVDALISCAGNTPEYWLENGPPDMTADLVECLNTYFGR